MFKRPSNVFVATLLGEPKINLIPCQVSQSGVQMTLTSQDGSIRLTPADAVRQKILRANLDNVMVGMRPFYITVASDGAAANVVDAKVYVYERLGTKGILTARAGKNILNVITPITMDFATDAPVRLAFEVESMIVFDPKTEQNILLDK